MKKLYVYADEATFLRGTEEITGTGIFISRQPIDHTIVTTAMQLLIEDPDFDKKLDTRTVEHNYFHASEDSKNAHSHFCRCIVSSCAGNFVYSYLSKNNRNDRSAEDLYRLTLKLVSSKFMDEPCDVEMVAEERIGFGQGSINRFIETFNHEHALLAYSLPSIINVFSKISITIADKTHPGLQVVDFMLWSMNRSMMIPKNNIWKDRLKLKLNEFVKSEDGDQSSGNYYLCRSVLYDSNIHNIRINYPYSVPKDIPEGGHIFDYYIYIENILKHFQELGVPAHCKHWNEAIQKSCELIAHHKFDEVSLKFICQTFICIFDTVPVYSDIADDDEQAWAEILFAKRLAGIIITNGGIHHGRTRNSILRWKWSQFKA